VADTLIIMIYLIGGSPRVGKTNLAEALARKTSFPYFSLDHVTTVVTPYISEQEYETKLPLVAGRLRGKPLKFLTPNILPNKSSISIFAQPKHTGLELRILFDMPLQMNTT